MFRNVANSFVEKVDFSIDEMEPSMREMIEAVNAFI